jgi:capsular polysaccharide export protein
VRIEDAFLRSIHPGRAGEPPLGLLIDRTGVHFDARRPSDLETLLARHPLDDAAQLAMVRDTVALIKAHHLSKYNGFDLDAPLPAPGYVLVIDQTRGDASLKACGADRGRFLEMLTFAQQEHPGARILIKTHPETHSGHRAGHLTGADASDRITLFDTPVSPWALLEGAVAVYTVSSGMGFEAILAGHRPRVFGTPFYAGWGLTEDEEVFPRRNRPLTRTQLALGALALFPKWYDPFHDALCPFDEAVAILTARAQQWRDDHAGWVAEGMRLWKRQPLQKMFGAERPMRFAANAEAKAAQTGRNAMVWAGKAQDGSKAVRVEDGFLRSRGLGADLVPPLSLVLDDVGIYYDPTRPSRLEALIAASPNLPPAALHRAEALRLRLIEDNITKYNLGGAQPALPEGHRILVPGQVEDDASMRLGAPGMTNADLLAKARKANPDAVILYKPHPDVVAGLRPGHVPTPQQWADAVIDGDMGQLLPHMQEVWTMTSLTGFEALLRGLRVTVLGQPFYAGWGLTRDLGPALPRRRNGTTLDGLVHATLIDYPRYRDPVTGLPCPAEIVAERLSSGRIPKPGPANRALAKLQGALSSYATLWRR